MKEKELNNTIFLIVGESACGKDTLCNMLQKDDYKILKSYTTRPQRLNENNTHIFIQPEEIEEYRNDIVAYTKIGDYEYFATRNQLINSHIYTVDPLGVKYLKNKVSDIKFVVIYINVDEDERKRRATNIRKDDIVEIQKRFDAEKSQFDEFKLNSAFDYSIKNYDSKKSYKILKKIIKIENKK